MAYITYDISYNIIVTELDIIRIIFPYLYRDLTEILQRSNEN